MSQAPQELSPLKRAYLALEKAQARLEAAERFRHEPIAVVGMACRFPGGVNSPADYWNLLAEGRDAVVEVPASRWDVDEAFDPDPDAPGKICSRFGGFIDNVDRFDAAFFGIAPREAESLDPQQRLLLEVAQEAMEDAAVAPEQLLDSSAGVFVGLANGDYYCLLTGHCRERIDAYMGTGTSPNSAAGRVSYVFGLRGPCVAVDTACSSSLVALHLACQALRAGECDRALAGGVNVMLTPDLSITFSKAHMLCPDGRCKTFDADANGYVRGEGVGLLLLKRLSDAQADGDRILAVVRGSAMNHAGASGGLTVPNGPAQQEVIRRALRQAKLRPDEVDYIEAHGTGTALGDPIEAGALGAVFASRTEPLWIGSVKTNLGHLEAAAGVAGVIKVILALQHETIPPHLHFRTPSPRIPWENLPLRVAARRQAWPAGVRPRVAGVSSFGFSGINAHVVLAEAPAVPSPVAGESGEQLQLLLLSARHPAALRQLAERYAKRLEDGSLGWADVAFTAAAGRNHYEHRLALVAGSGVEARELLERFARGEEVSAVYLGETSAQSRPAAPFPPDDADRKTMLESLAHQYVAGATLDWRALAAATGGRKADLPTYPYQRRRYWVHDAPTTAADAAPAAAAPLHPLLGRPLLLAGADDGRYFESRLTARRPPLLEQHRLAAVPIMPAAGFFEIALAGSQEVAGDGQWCLAEVTLDQAMPLAERPARVVQWIARPSEAGYRFELFSRLDVLGGTGAAAVWMRHAHGRLAEANRPPAETDLGGVQLRCAEEISLESFYGQLEQRGLRYGPLFRGLRRLWRGEGEALGKVELSAEAAQEMGQYCLYPPLLDACLHVTAELLDPRVAGSDASPRSYVPVGVDRFHFLRSPGPVVWSHARLCDALAVQDASRYRIDLDLVDPSGALVARLEGLQVQQVDLDVLARELARRQETGTESAGDDRLADELARLPDDQRRQRVAQFLEGHLVKVLKLGPDERPSHQRNLFELGLDSLMSVELLYRINETLRLNLSMQVLLENAAIAPLAEVIARELGTRPTTDAAAIPSASPSAESQPTPPASAVAAPGLAARLLLLCCAPPELDGEFFSQWQQALGQAIDVRPIDWPGAADGPPAEEAAEALLELLDRPYALFGVGEGARLAFELARTVQDRFGLAPEQVILADPPPPAGAGPIDCPLTVLSSAAAGDSSLTAWQQRTRDAFRLETLAEPTISAGIAATTVQKLLAQALAAQ